MKKKINLLKIITIIIVVLVSINLNAQSVVTYDFANSTLDIDNAKTKRESAKAVKGFAIVPYKGFVDIKITNIDPQFKVEVNKKAINYTYPQEEQLVKAAGVTRTVYSHINYIDSDELIVTIQITDTNETKIREVQFTIKTYGHFKLNISTGAIFNIRLNDENYEIQNNTIVDTGTDDFLPIFPVALSHAYFKGYRNINVGALFGFGITDGNNVSFYTGSSFIFGENQRFILGGGIGLRKVKQLKSQYSTGQTLTGTPPNISDITHDPYKLGYFVSISYNLTSKKE